MATRRLRNVASSCGSVLVCSKKFLSCRCARSSETVPEAGADAVMKPSTASDRCCARGPLYRGSRIERGLARRGGQWLGPPTTGRWIVRGGLRALQCPPGAQREFEQEPGINVVEIDTENFLHLGQPVANRVGVHVQDACGLFEVAVAGEVGI